MCPRQCSSCGLRGTMTRRHLLRLRFQSQLQALSNGTSTASTALLIFLVLLFGGWSRPRCQSCRLPLSHFEVRQVWNNTFLTCLFSIDLQFGSIDERSHADWLSRRPVLQRGLARFMVVCHAGISFRWRSACVFCSRGGGVLSRSCNVITIHHVHRFSDQAYCNLL